MLKAQSTFTTLLIIAAVLKVLSISKSRYYTRQTQAALRITELSNSFTPFKVLTPDTAPKAINPMLYLFSSYAYSGETLPCSGTRGFSNTALKL